jgi:AcrR family transcriptional regulator
VLLDLADPDQPDRSRTITATEHHVSQTEPIYGTAATSVHGLAGTTVRFPQTRPLQPDDGIVISVSDLRSEPEHNSLHYTHRVKRAPVHSVPRARVGRPRDRQIDAAVLDATLAVLDRFGYGRLTLEEVARLAGTTKPAIYRRWASRQRLVLAALGGRLGEARAPDTGCTLCDLDECLKVFVAAFRRMPPDVLGPLFADCAADRDLRAAFMTSLFDPPRAAVREALDRAYARGDLRDDVDLGLILDLIGSLVYYRAVFGHARTSDVEIERAVEALLQGIATDYPSLLEHSRRVSGQPKLHRLHA